MVQIRPDQWHSFGRGKMGRVSYELSEDNRRRLEPLTAFGILNGHYPSRDEIVNESIRQYFMRVYEEYGVLSPKPSLFCFISTSLDLSASII